MIKRALPTLALVYIVAIVFGVWGYITHCSQIFPYKIVNNVHMRIKNFLVGGEGENKSIPEKILIHNQEKRNTYDYHGFVIRDNDSIDVGYLLLSRFSRKYDQVVVDLVRLRDFKLLHRWVPPIKEIIEMGDREETTGDLHLIEQGFRVQHPILLEDGSIVFNHGEGYLARIGKDNQIIWVNGHHFHHSIEKWIDGNLLTTININPPQTNYPPGWRDDGYAIVSLEGEVLTAQSVSKILINNGYLGLLNAYCQVKPKDPLHLNDAQPIYEDNGIIKRGDIAFSMRHPNTVAIYRPSTDEIIALQQGPWLLQHDINILPDGKCSIFNNFLYENNGGSNETMSSIFIWDPVVGDVKLVYSDIFRKANIFTPTSGRARILPDGDVFVEESDRNRLLRVSSKKVRWEFVNAHEDTPELSGAVHWSRYYLPEEIRLGWLE